MTARPLGTTHPTEAEDASTSEASISAAIEAYDGDLRATVRTLIVATVFLEEELNRVLAMISRGYSRLG